LRHKVKEFFSIYLILLATLSPGVYSASNRNEYQKQKNNVSWGVNPTLSRPVVLNLYETAAQFFLYKTRAQYQQIYS
jgi:hypothetical protein